MTIHHTILKQAQKLGVTITETDSHLFVVTQGDTQLADGDTAKEAMARAVASLPKAEKAPRKPRATKATKPRKAKKARKTSDEDGEEGDEEEGGEEGDEEEGGSKSVITPKYKKKYRPHRDTCGDAFVDAMNAFLYEDGAEDLDPVRLVQLGRANGVDVNARWPGKNIGMRRMNLGNVLRGLIRKGTDVKIGKTVIPGAKVEKE